jgi:hypothetical protein
MEHKLIKMEQETSILGNADSREWDIVTCDPKYVRGFERKGWKAEGPADEWGAKRFKLPLRAIGIRNSKKRPRSGIANTLALRKAARIDQRASGKG